HQAHPVLAIEVFQSQRTVWVRGGWGIQHPQVAEGHFNRLLHRLALQWFVGGHARNVLWPLHAHPIASGLRRWAILRSDRRPSRQLLTVCGAGRHTPKAEVARYAD